MLFSAGSSRHACASRHASNAASAVADIRAATAPSAECSTTRDHRKCLLLWVVSSCAVAPLKKASRYARSSQRVPGQHVRGSPGCVAALALRSIERAAHGSGQPPVGGDYGGATRQLLDQLGVHVGHC